MAKRKEQKVVLTYEVAKQGADDVKRINAQIKQNFEDAAKAIKRGGIAGVQEFRRLTSETRTLEKELKDVERLFASTGKNAPRFIAKTKDEFKKLNKTIKQGTANIRDFDEENSLTRQRTGILGDVGGAGRGIGAGVGRIPGFEGLEQGISVLAEIPDSLEAIGNLKPAIAGVPDAMESLASGLGMTGLGLGAAAVLAVGGFALLSNEMNKSTEAAKKMAEQQVANAQVFADVQQAVDLGDLESVGQMINQTTTDLTNAQLELGRLESDRMEALIEAQMRINNLTREEAIGRIDTEGIQKLSNDLRAFETVTLGLSGSSQDAISGFRVLDKAYKEAIETEADLAATLHEQNVTLQENNLTLTDAVKATKESTEAETDRSAVILQQAELTRTTSLQQASLLQQSTEQLEARTDAINTERDAIQLAIGELETNAEQTDKVTEAIASYNDQLGRLSTEQEFINSQALRSAELREQDATQQARLAALIERRMDKQKEAAAAQEADFEARAKLEEDFSKDLVALSEKTADASEKALANLQSKLADLNKGLQRDFEKAGRDRGRKELEARVKAQQAEVDAFTDHKNKLQDIQRSAFENEQDAQQSRDFKSIFNTRRQARRSIQDEQKNFSRDAKQRNIENARARDERLQAFNAERQERLIKFSQSIADTRTRFAQEQADAMQAARNTINLRRQQYTQQLTDLQQSGNMELRMRRNIINSETGMISQLEQFAAAAFGRVSNFGGGFSQFGGGDGSSNQSTTNNSTSVLSNIVVNARPNQGVSELAQNTQNAIKALL